MKVRRKVQRIGMLCIAVVLQLASFSYAADNLRLPLIIYVDTKSLAASDSNTGTAKRPLKTIGRAMDLAQNDRGRNFFICIRGGIYREQPYIWASNGGRSTTERTIVSAYIDPATKEYEPVYVNAADPIVGNWIRDGDSNRWYLGNFKTPTSGVWVDWSATNDSAGLQQIGGCNGETTSDRKIIGSGTGDMYAGSYFADLANSRLYVWLPDGGNPNSHAVEYASRCRAFYQPGSASPGGGYSYANYVDFKGLKLRHANVYAAEGQDTGCAVYTTGDERLIDCDIQWNAGVGVYLRGTSQMINCICSNNGSNGVAAQGNGFLIRSGHYNSNFWRQYKNGSDAAIKVITNKPTLYGDIQNVEVASNYGKGIWYDTCFQNQTVSQICGNYIHDNEGDGIDLEASRNYVLDNNTIADNQGDGISINAVENAQIRNNIVVGNHGIAAIELNGGTRDQGSAFPGTTGTSNISVRNNIIVNNFSVYDLGMPTSAAGSKNINNNSSDCNLFYRRGGPLHFTTGGTYLGWAATPSALEAWRTVAGQDAHSIVGDPLFVAGGSGVSSYICGTNSPIKLLAANPRIAATKGTAEKVDTHADPTVWIEDQLPDNAAMTAPDQSGNTQRNRFWQWNSRIVFCGAVALDSTVVTGMHRQYFTGSAARRVGANDFLFAYVWIDPCNPPRQIMLEWCDSDGSWNHLAYWGQNLITVAMDASKDFHKVGALPPTGRWALLQIAAKQIGLANAKITGFSFDLFDGRALLDHIGNGPAR